MKNSGAGWRGGGLGRGKDSNSESVHLPGVLFGRRGAGGKKGGVEGGGRGSARGDKNSPNPSLITMPAKSEILTAVAPRRAAPRRITPRRREKRRTERESEREKEREEGRGRTERSRS